METRQQNAQQGRISGTRYEKEQAGVPTVEKGSTPEHNHAPVSFIESVAPLQELHIATIVTKFKYLLITEE